MYYDWNIFGHEKTLEFLEYHVRGGTLGHAMLLSGPEHIGKFRILKTLSQILQCENGFCKTCPTCQQIEKGYHLDTIEILNDGQSIKIEQIRDILGRLHMTSQSPCKILLLENIGRMTEEAGNSLLKILEEPGEKTYFFFTVGSLREVLPTIQSRMQILKMKTPSMEKFFEYIKTRYPQITKDKWRELEMLSLGKPGEAVALLEAPEIFEACRERYEMVKHFFSTISLVTRFSIAQGFKDDAVAVREFITMMIFFLRYILFSGRQPEKLLALKFLPKFAEAYELTKKNVNSRLLLENLILSL